MKIWQKKTNPLQKRRFPINIHSKPLAVTHSENRKSTRVLVFFFSEILCLTERPEFCSFSCAKWPVCYVVKPTNTSQAAPTALVPHSISGQAIISVTYRHNTTCLLRVKTRQIFHRYYNEGDRSEVRHTSAVRYTCIAFSQ